MEILVTRNQNIIGKAITPIKFSFSSQLPTLAKCFCFQYALQFQAKLIIF